MSKRQPCGMFATPYGVEVPAYQPDNADPAGPEELLFSLDTTAICAGIYSKAERKRFVADVARLGRAPAIEDYGGGAVHRIPLSRPSSPAYPRVSRLTFGTPIEALVRGTVDQRRWRDRATFLLEVVDSNMRHVAGVNSLVEGVYPIGISLLITAALEALEETEIACIEAAALYACTEHAEWRAAGIAWLEPHRRTWFRDWRNARPEYERLTRALAKPYQLPGWLGRRAAR